MSHFATIETQIKDIEALRAACRELGLNMLQNANARGYDWSDPSWSLPHVTKEYCEKRGYDWQAIQEKRQSLKHGAYVIQLPGKMDIAVNKDTKGNWTFEADFSAMDFPAIEKIGRNAAKLVQMYGVHKATQEAKRKGLTVQRTVQSNGAIKLVIGGYR